MIVDSSGATDPSGPTRSPVTAVTVTMFVIGVPEFVMNCFVPSIVHHPSARVAVVLVPPASDPASASVRPNAARFSPRANGGK